MWEVVKQFEREIRRYTGAPRAIAVESCTAALFLSCLRQNVKQYADVELPSITYPSVPSAIIHAGGRVRFVKNVKWQNSGYYALIGCNAGQTLNIAVDSAKYIGRNMWEKIGMDFICLSFHHKKALPIGRGGMILCEKMEDEEWLRWMKHDGRTEGASLTTDKLHCIGWNMSFTPEQAARGLALLDNLPDDVILPKEPYQNLNKYPFFKDANR
jgi:dTDP-4-amino-4,6-dideoxygalactose transaminase